VLRRGDKGAEVKKLQETLLRINPSCLPRYGADSDLGDETLRAIGAVLGTQADAEPDDVSDAEIALLASRLGALSQAPLRPAQYIDCRGIADEGEVHGRRQWSQIDSVVLHQTACVLGGEPRRWRSVPIHYGITREGVILQLHDDESLLWHAHALNRFSVGVEIDGYFEGIQGQRKTCWVPPDNAPERQPLRPSIAQIESAKQLIRYLGGLFAARGGRLTKILAHRQGTNTRRPDPGSEIWQTIALPMQRELALKPSHDLVWGKGQPIPREWDPISEAEY
jgi:hypothetical protein